MRSRGRAVRVPEPVMSQKLGVHPNPVGAFFCGLFSLDSGPEMPQNAGVR
mgnify:CR=1 FL=1